MNELLVVLMTAVHEALIILYTRTIVGQRVWLVTLITMVLAVLGYIGTIIVTDNHDMVPYATVGHGLGVPLGMFIPLPGDGSGTAGPTRRIGFRSSGPS